MKLCLSKAAQADVQDISDYTAERWGETQQDRYLRLLDAAFAKIAELPEQGRPCDHIRPGLRRYQGRGLRHVLYFEAKPEGVVILRVLHVSQLPGLHLRGDT